MRTTTATEAQPEAEDEVPEQVASEQSEAEEPDREPEPEPDPEPARRRRWPLSETSVAVLIGVIVVCAVGGLVGWLGLVDHRAHAAERERQLFLDTARQGAVNLTTIRYTDVDADIQRVLDSATGAFLDEFQANSAQFADAVRQAKSSSTGAISEAGIESIDGDTARVLVTTAVRTGTADVQEQDPRYWRMRMTVNRLGPGVAKISNVEFVP